MMPHWFWISILMGFLTLDVLAVGQFMLSRPVVVGPLVGFLTGHPDLGLEMGALLELIWIGDLPVGAHLPMDLTVLTGVSVGLASELSQGKYPAEAAMTYAMGVAIPLAMLSMQVELLARKLHIRWMHFALKLVSTSHLRAFDWVNHLVLLEHFARGFLVTALGLILAHLTAPLFQVFPPRVMEGLYYSHWLLLALGCSAVIDMLVEKRTVPYLILSIFAIMVLAGFQLVGGALLVILAIVVGFGITLYYAGRGEAVS